MGKWKVQFGSKTFDTLMKNSAKAVTEMNDVFLKETWNTALKMVKDLDAAYDEYIDDAKHWDIDDEQADIYNRNAQSYHQNTRDIIGDDGEFNALRGTNTAIKAYATYSKKTGLITVGVTGPDILYMEYGTGDIGESTEDPEARNAATDIDLKGYNSGPMIRNKDGYNYWTYHSSVHFGMPTGAVVYNTFKDYKKNIANTTKSKINTYLKSVYSGKDIK
jgi:hypothetical protein